MELNKEVILHFSPIFVLALPLSVPGLGDFHYNLSRHQQNKGLSPAGCFPKY